MLPLERELQRRSKEVHLVSNRERKRHSIQRRTRNLRRAGAVGTADNRVLHDQMGCRPGRNVLSAQQVDESRRCHGAFGFFRATTPSQFAAGRSFSSENLTASPNPSTIGRARTVPIEQAAETSHGRRFNQAHCRSFTDPSRFAWRRCWRSSVGQLAQRDRSGSAPRAT